MRAALKSLRTLVAPVRESAILRQLYQATGTSVFSSSS
jgi:hypothetical protein